jgi:hypothetical protein
MIFKAGDGVKSGAVAASIKTVLTRMGWTEYSRDEGHTKDQVNLIFSKRPKISDLQVMFPSE